MKEDAELLRAYARDRSEEAFAELVRRHVDFVYGSALRRVNGDAHLARDVTQMVFVDLSRKAASLGERTVLAGWLYTSARYAASNVVRSEQRRRLREKEANTMHELHGTPAIQWEELRPVLEEAMDRLGDRDREAVLLRFFEDQTLAAVGAKLALSEDGARMRVDRALEKLRVALARRGVMSTAGALATVLASQPVTAAPSGLAAAIVQAATATPLATATMALTIWQALSATKIAVGLATVGAIATLAVVALDRDSSAGRRESPMVETRDPTPRLTISPRIAAVEADQEFRQRLVALSRARLDETYGPLFLQLNLAAPRLEQFKDLLIEKQRIRSDVEDMSGSPVQMTGVAREDFFRAVVEKQRDADGRIERLLEAAGYQQYLTYEFNYARRTTVRWLQKILGEDDRLTTDQVELLVEVMSEKAYFSPVRRSAGLSLESGAGMAPEPVNTVNDDALLAAKMVLSPVQWRALKQIQQRFQPER